MKSLSVLLIVALINIFISSCGAAKSGTEGNTAKYDELVQQQQYTFVARSVTPTEDSRYSPSLMLPPGSNLYQLSSGYDLRITPDSVIAYLPFFGRAYVAPMDPTKGGINFTSTKFDYQVSKRKKNYEITISPKDVQDVRTIYLTISPSGYASAQVLSVNRTPIAFNGIIEVNK